jgi:hypothetical protein
MNYRVTLDNSMTWISLTEDEPDGDNVFATLKEAKEYAKADLQDSINKLRYAIRRIKRLKIKDIKLVDFD